MPTIWERQISRSISTDKSDILETSIVNKTRVPIEKNVMSSKSNSADWNYILSFINGLTTLEVGGPTYLFYRPNHQLNCYDNLNRIDCINNYDSTYFTSNTDPEGLKYMTNIYNIKTYDYADLETNNTYDLLLSSHVLEHMCNPIKLIKELQKCMKPQSYILTIVPNKYGCWDSSRDYTTFNHILSDYTNNVGEDDLTHIHEVLSCPHPYKDSHGEEEFRKICENNYITRFMHNHVFDIECLTKLHEFTGYKTIYCNFLPEDSLQLIYFGKLQ